jgi:hypothetical protein
VVAIALLIEIFTDYTFRFSGPNWLGNAIAIVGIGIILFMSWRAWGDRLKRRRGGGGTAWPGNDVRTERTWPRRDRDASSTDATTPEPPDRTDQPTR